MPDRTHKARRPRAPATGAVTALLCVLALAGCGGGAVRGGR